MKARILLVGHLDAAWERQLRKVGLVERAASLEPARALLATQTFDLVLAQGPPARIEELLKLAPHLIHVHEDSEQSLLRSVLDNLPHMVFVKDAQDLRFVRWNKAGAQLVGISQEEMIGKTDFDFFPEDEAAGARYFVGDVRKDPIILLRDAGFNAIRLRIFVDPAKGYSRREPDKAWAGLAPAR